jgi:CubicO group peptidase (beta-lactamase class C family)
MIDSLDQIITQMITEQAAPGGQLLVAKNGKIGHHQAYGYLTYDSLVKVVPETLFDLASLTKVVATTPGLIHLFDQQKVNLDSSIGHYLPHYLHSNKNSITLKELLAHQGGLKPYIPFWKRTLSPDYLEVFYYSNDQDETRDRRRYGLTPTPLLADSLKAWVLNSEVRDKKYQYSDLGFMILQEVLETSARLPLDEYLARKLYTPLKLEHTFFNPIESGIPPSLIAPTEYDHYFRDTLVWGSVHDRNAAILDGVAGHAGLFSNAFDLARLMQLFLQKGQYDGKVYFSAEAVEAFNQRYFPDNRRGLGWDKPQDNNFIVSDHASDSSFGHTGFTGTMVWADPKHQMIMVFLSNRIYPSSENHQMSDLRIRRRLHDTLYQSLSIKEGKEQF